MILIGYSFKELLNKMFGHKIVCPHCHAESNILVTVFCKVLYLTFIPIWAGEKCVDITCQNCNTNIDCYQYGDQSLTQFSGQLQKSAKIKWYYFVGLLPFLFYFGFLIYAAILDNYEY